MNIRKVKTWKAAVISALALAVVGSVLAYGYLYGPKVESSSFRTSSQVALDADLVVRFSKPVNRRELIPTITPEISGEWTYEQPLFGRHLFRALRFVANRPFEPETAYTVEFKGMTDILKLGPKKTAVNTFTTIGLPKVSAVTPTDGSKKVSPQARPIVKLTAPAGEYSEFTFQFHPTVTITAVLNEARNEFTLTPTEPFVQGTKYALTVAQTFVVRDRQTGAIVLRSEPSEVYSGKFSITTSPKLENVTPTGNNVAVTEPIQLIFSEAMRDDSFADRFQIEPETKGTLTLSDDKKVLTYSPDKPLAHDTEYSVILKSGAATAQGGWMTKDAEFLFRTIGPVRVASIQPDDGAGGISVTSRVRIAFDQEVDKPSAEQAVSFVPGVEPSYSWDGNTLIVSPKASFAYSTVYHLMVAKGIGSIRGLSSAADFTSTFMTVDKTAKLPIEIDLQDRALSCEAAALKMALAGKGISVSESDIMAHIQVQPGPRQGNIWGDPYIAFVGDINGKQNTTGYGVYWSPIAAAADQWRPAEAFTGWTVGQALAEVSAGNPVVVWGVYGNGYKDDWSTTTGKHIDAWKGEHARTLIGFTGTPENPTTIILNDPYAGQATWTRDRFSADWARFGNSGVVVR